MQGKTPLENYQSLKENAGGCPIPKQMQAAMQSTSFFDSAAFKALQLTPQALQTIQTAHLTSLEDSNDPQTAVESQLEINMEHVKNGKSVTQAPVEPTPSVAIVSQDASTQFRYEHSLHTKEIYKNVRETCMKICAGIKESELEIMRKEDEAYMIQRAEVELSKLSSQQIAEVKRKEECFKAALSARENRKKAKQMLRKMSRETKIRDLKIYQQDLAAKIASEIKAALNDKRQAYEASGLHWDTRHETQRRQLSAAQERIMLNEKTLIDLESRHLREEIRNSVMKDGQLKMNHRKNLNKRIGEHLRETQRLEIQHSKERFDAEYTAFEEIQQLYSVHALRVDELEAMQYVEIGMEKERLSDLKETLKVMTLETTHISEMKKLVAQHRAQYKQLKQSHRENMRKLSSRAASRNVSCHGSKLQSRAASGEFFEDEMNAESLSNAFNQLTSRNGENEEKESIQDQVNRLELNLRECVIRHTEAKNQLVQQQREERENKQRISNEQLRELFGIQETEMHELINAQETEIADLHQVQEREVQMQKSIFDAECKALLERKMLNSILDTVVDGIVNIDPKGIISRFNFAAEKMFGYSAAEVIGKNIKMIMPMRYAESHDQYLLNYMTTGVKKVIGSGRKLFGKKKDGNEFPVHLSVSEVKEDGAHVFTGIVRDISEEVEAEKNSKIQEIVKQKEQHELVGQLNKYKAQAESLISNMLPAAVSQNLMRGIPVPPQAFDKTSIFFSDIVGFTSLSAVSSPFQIVQLLNDLYTAFDEVIQKYDCYKVETIGDAYMVSSGVPKANGDRHSAEIATMALELLSTVNKFKISYMPEKKLQIRIGLHTGPVVAGVVGSKMPRYCLFGDTVSIASHMESSGSAMRIQISEAMYEALQNVGGFKFSYKGETYLKSNNGNLKTYWLTGIGDPDDEIAVITVLLAGVAMTGTRRVVEVVGITGTTIIVGVTDTSGITSDGIPGIAGIGTILVGPAGAGP